MNEEKLLIAIITVIKRKRLQKGLSQENLAFFSGLDRTYISGVERGVRNLTINSLDAIIKGLNISKKDFLKEVITHIEDNRNQ
jgi:transcriptional regulator with XRE-family HTH domain